MDDDAGLGEEKMPLLPFGEETPLSLSFCCAMSIKKLTTCQKQSWMPGKQKEATVLYCLEFSAKHAVVDNLKRNILYSLEHGRTWTRGRQVLNAPEDIPCVSVEFHPAVEEDKTINLQEDG